MLNTVTHRFTSVSAQSALLKAKVGAQWHHLNVHPSLTANGAALQTATATGAAFTPQQMSIGRSDSDWSLPILCESDSDSDAAAHRVIIGIDSDDDPPQHPPPPSHNASRLKRQRSKRRTEFLRDYRRKLQGCKRLNVQAKAFNASGHARTVDHKMPVVEPKGGNSKQKKAAAGIKLKAAKTAKRGPGWKNWTGEAICKTSASPAQHSVRGNNGPNKGSPSHKWACKLFTASLVMDRQADMGRNLREGSLTAPLQFFISNHMHDETKLWVAAPGGGRAKRRRVLAQGCQISYKAPNALETVDIDVIRPPSLLQQYNADTCAAVVADPTDLFGLNPSESVQSKAAFYGYLQATDSHSVNKKLSKWLAVQVRGRNIKNGHCQHKIPTPELVEADTGTANGTAIGDAVDTEPDPAMPLFAWDTDTDSGDDVPPPADNDTAEGAAYGDDVPTAPDGGGDASSSTAGDPSKPFSVHLPQYCCQHDWQRGGSIHQVARASQPMPLHGFMPFSR